MTDFQLEQLVQAAQNISYSLSALVVNSQPQVVIVDQDKSELAEVRARMEFLGGVVRALATGIDQLGKLAVRLDTAEQAEELQDAVNEVVRLRQREKALLAKTIINDIDVKP